MDTAFLGKGMKFPPAVNKATGRFIISEGNENIKEAIYVILMTAKTERFMRPSFGTSIMKYTFMDTNATMLNLFKNELREDIEEAEPRVTDVDINFDTTQKQGVLFVNIDYTVIGENVRENLVFPFYLNDEADGEQKEELLDEDEQL